MSVTGWRRGGAAEAADGVGTSPLLSCVHLAASTPMTTNTRTDDELHNLHGLMTGRGEETLQPQVSVQKGW